MSFLSQPITLQTLFGPKRTIGPYNVQVIKNEATNDVLTITKQPVQKGAAITDHSFKEPTVFSCNILLQDNKLSSLLTPLANSGLAKLYEDFRRLQDQRIPFDIVTPKRVYKNVLMATLGMTTDKETENCLALSMSFQQIIIVNVTLTLNRAVLQHPAKTQATQKAGNKSAIKTLFGPSQ